MCCGFIFVPKADKASWAGLPAPTLSYITRRDEGSVTQPGHLAVYQRSWWSAGWTSHLLQDEEGASRKLANWREPWKRRVQPHSRLEIRQRPCLQRNEKYFALTPTKPSTAVYLWHFVFRARESKGVSFFLQLDWVGFTSTRHGLHIRSSILPLWWCENELTNDPHLSTITTDPAFLFQGGGRKAVRTLRLLLDRHWVLHFSGKPPTNQPTNQLINLNFESTNSHVEAS